MSKEFFMGQLLTDERDEEWVQILSGLSHREQELIENLEIGPTSVLFNKGHPYGLILKPYDDTASSYALVDNGNNRHFIFLLNLDIIVAGDILEYDSICQRPDIVEYQKYKRRWDAYTGRLI